MLVKITVQRKWLFEDSKTYCVDVLKVYFYDETDMICQQRDVKIYCDQNELFYITFYVKQILYFYIIINNDIL